MIFGRSKKEDEDKDQKTLTNQMRQFHIEQFKAEFKNKAHMDYKEALQKLVTELVSEDEKRP